MNSSIRCSTSAGETHGLGGDHDRLAQLILDDPARLLPGYSERALELAHDAPRYCAAGQPIPAARHPRRRIAEGRCDGASDRIIETDQDQSALRPRPPHRTARTAPKLRLWQHAAGSLLHGEGVVRHERGGRRRFSHERRRSSSAIALRSAGVRQGDCSRIGARRPRCTSRASRSITAAAPTDRVPAAPRAPPALRMSVASMSRSASSV